MWSKLREDFPVLERRLNGKRIIYFDSGCMALKPLQVINSVLRYYRDISACGGRSTHCLAAETTELCQRSREMIQQFINARSNNEIVWTRNATEAINIVAHSWKFSRGDTILSTSLEHHSGILPFHKIATMKGLNLRVVNPNREGSFDLEQLHESFDRTIKMVSIIHASNFTGTVTPLKQIVKLAHDYNAVVVADSAQFVPHHITDVKDLDVDFLCFSIHKMCGPTGLGILYGKEEHLQEMDTFLVGGDTIQDVYYDSNQITPEYLPPPNKFEAGLQNYAGIIGAGAAVEYLKNIGMENISKRGHRLTERLLKGLLQFKAVKIIGPNKAKYRGPLVSFRIEGIDASFDISNFLDHDIEDYCIMVRSGTHCVNPFHYHLGIQPSQGTTRASLYFYNTDEEIQIFMDKLQELIQRTR